MNIRTNVWGFKKKKKMLNDLERVLMISNNDLTVYGLAKYHNSAAIKQIGKAMECVNLSPYSIKPKIERFLTGHCRLSKHTHGPVS